MLQTVLFAPHPPIAMAEIGAGEERKMGATLSGYERLARRMGELKPEVVVYITVHGVMYHDSVALLDEARLKGDMSAFRCPEVAFSKLCDRELIKKLFHALHVSATPCVRLDSSKARKPGACALDHGVLVPMYFLDRGWAGYEAVVLSPGFMEPAELYHAGAAIGKALLDYDKRVVVVASGDLSHRLLESGPYGFTQEGVEFDRLLTDAFKENEPERILDLSPWLLEKAGECGHRPFCMALGIAGKSHETQVYSYEGPFGVGYMTAEVRPVLKAAKRGEPSDPYIRLAYETVVKYVKGGGRLDGGKYARENGLPAEITSARSGAFVTIYKNGELRGCIGTILPTQKTLADEIAYCAVESCSSDPRFPPVAPYELDKISIKVDVLSAPEEISGLSELDPKIYGVIVEKGFRRGLLLPDLPGVDTAAEQVRIASRKAGIAPGETGLKLSRFTVTRHEEN